mgnify:FL=1
MYLRRTELYGPFSIVELFEADESAFSHSFGGAVQHQGAVTQEHGDPLHLLYRLNTDDPEIPISIPGVRWVPLYYCFNWRSGMTVGYRVESESKIETFPLARRFKNYVSDESEYPYDGFPDQFDIRAVVATRSAFDPLNREHVREYIDVFGTESLGERSRRELIDDLRSDYNLLDEGPADDSDEALLMTISGPSCQGHPENTCPNPGCGNHSAPRSMRIIAIVPAYPFGDSVEHETLDVFSPWGEQCDLPCSDLEIVYEMCPVCSAIMATSQALT